MLGLDVRNDWTECWYSMSVYSLQYKKPKELLVFDKIVKEELQKLKAGKDGDVDCTPS